LGQGFGLGTVIAILSPGGGDEKNIHILNGGRNFGGSGSSGFCAGKKSPQQQFTILQFAEL